MATSEVMTAGLTRDLGARVLEAYEALQPTLVGALTQLLGSHDDALDAAQNAFLKCWRSRGQLTDVHDLRAWIYRVGINAGRDLARDSWRCRWRSLVGNADVPGKAVDLPVEREKVERLTRALADLSPGEREVFLLRQNSDRTYEEIAQMTDLPVGTVKTRMRTAISKLRDVLRESVN